MLTFVADMQKHLFTIRKYGRTELAQLYSPDVQPESAWVTLKQWISLSPGLREKLCSLGYNGSTRSFSPVQVQAIVDAIGEP